MLSRRARQNLKTKQKLCSPAGWSWRNLMGEPVPSDWCSKPLLLLLLLLLLLPVLLMLKLLFFRPRNVGSLTCNWSVDTSLKVFSSVMDALGFSFICFKSSERYEYQGFIHIITPSTFPSAQGQNNLPLFSDCNSAFALKTHSQKNATSGSLWWFQTRKKSQNKRTIFCFLFPFNVVLAPLVPEPLLLAHPVERPVAFVCQCSHIN